MSTTSTSKTKAPTLRSGFWNIDPEHSHLGFYMKHLGIARVHGWFEEFHGSVHIGEDDYFLAEGIARAASLKTGNRNRDIHVREDEDFLFAARYPQIYFRAEKIEPGGKGMYLIYGELSLHGYKRPVQWRMHLHGYVTDPQDHQRMAVTVEGVLNRKEWGMDWNQFLEAGGFLVSNEVRLQLDLSLVLSEKHPPGVI